MSHGFILLALRVIGYLTRSNRGAVIDFWITRNPPEIRVQSATVSRRVAEEETPRW
jgi:hypothetical protein